MRKSLEDEDLDVLAKKILEDYDSNNPGTIFKTKILTTENRDLSNYKLIENLHDTEKWLLVNEGRPKKMQWIVCTPR